MDYRIIRNTHLDTLQESVRQHLSLGWTLIGPPFSHSGCVCQAMTHQGAFGKVPVPECKVPPVLDETLFQLVVERKLGAGIKDIVRKNLMIEQPKIVQHPVEQPKPKRGYNTWANYTPEQRKARARKQAALIRKSLANRTPEQRAEQNKKLSDAAKQRWSKRRQALEERLAQNGS